MSEFEDEVGSVGVDIVGTCTRMCSEDECRDREVFYEVSVFEATAETVRLPPNKRRIDRQKAIKKYRRSAAGTKNAQDATLLRTLEALSSSVSRILDLFVAGIQGGDDCLHQPLHIVYQFVEDRARAVRQDISVQRLELDAVPILEKLGAFYIFSESLLKHEPASHFDVHLNRVQLESCLQVLKSSYSRSGKPSENCGLFMSCFLLLGMRPCTASLRDVFSTCMHNSKGESSSDLSRCLEIQRAITSCCWEAFFILATNAGVLHRCLLNSLVSEVRFQALEIMNKVFGKAEKVPVVDLQELLHFSSEEAAAVFCKRAGSPFTEDQGAVIMKVATLLKPAEVEQLCPLVQDFEIIEFLSQQ